MCVLRSCVVCTCARVCCVHVCVCVVCTVCASSHYVVQSTHSPEEKAIRIACLLREELRKRETVMCAYVCGMCNSLCISQR